MDPEKTDDDREPSLTKDEMSEALGFDPFADPSKLSDGGTGDQKGQPDKDDSEVQAGEADKPAAEPKARGKDGKFEKKTADEPVPEAEAAGEPEPPVDTAPKEPAKTEPEKKEESPEFTLLKSQVDLLQQSNKTMQALLDRQTAPPAQTPTAAATTPTTSVPDYAVNLPDDLMEGLASEDLATRKANMNALIKGTAQVIHRTVMQHVEQRMQQVVPTMVTGHAHEISEQQRIHKDFYGKYPNLVGAQALVGQEAAALSVELGAGASWNDTFRDAVHARVMQVLQGVRPAATPPAVAPAAGNGSKPPVARRSGTRQAASSDGPNTETDIADTLFGAT